jgi:hypothetical protein
MNESQEIESIFGSRYLSLLVDGHTSKLFFRCIRTKSEARDHTIDVIENSHNFTELYPRYLRSDGGGEYISTPLVDYLMARGVTQELTAPDTPQNNSKVERAFQTIFRLVRAMLLQAGLPRSFWPLAAQAACFIYNRCHIRLDLGATPDAIWFGFQPPTEFLVTFGSDCFYRPTEYLSKLDNRAEKGIMVGYTNIEQTYLIFSLSTQKLIRTRDVEFHDGKFIHAAYLGHIFQSNPLDQPQLNYHDSYRDSPYRDTTQPHPDLPNPDQSSDNILNLSITQSEEEERIRTRQIKATESSQPSSTKRTRRPPSRYGGVNYESSELILDDEVLFSPKIRKKELIHKCVISLLSNDPNSYKEAMSRSDAKLWKEAINKEWSSILENSVLTASNLPIGFKAIACRWVFKTKRNADGQIVKYKARLVIKGFMQRFGIDYNETYAPVMKYPSLRILLSLAAIYDLEIKQFDVVTAFLNATLEEEVYMQQPEGFQSSDSSKVYRLNKALYGLKQAPLAWNNDINNFLTSTLKFTRCKSDPCIYIRRTPSNGLVILGLFVDDIIALYRKFDELFWIKIKDQIQSKYKIEDLGDAHFILGIRITRDRPNRIIHLDQQAFIEKALDRFGFTSSSSVLTPGTEYAAIYPSATTYPDNNTYHNDISTYRGSTYRDSTYRDSSHREIILTNNDINHRNNFPPLDKSNHEIYMQMSGSINYAAISTRPDLSHANSITSRFNHDPKENHFVALKRIIRYLRGTTSLKLTLDGKLKGNPFSITMDKAPSVLSYSDSDHAGDPDGRKSISGCIIKLNNCPVIWYSHKQNAVSRSSCEAEIIAMADAVQEIKWLQELLHEIFTISYPLTVLYVDNSSTISISKRDLAHTKTRHIAVNYYWIKDFYDSQRISYKWIKSTDNQADIFTKPLANPAFTHIRKLLMGA